MTIVMLTLGESHQPIRAALAGLKPDRVGFLCSADTLTVKGSRTQVVGERKAIRSKPDPATSPATPPRALPPMMHAGGGDISPRVGTRALLDDPVWRITPFLRATLAGVRVA